MAKPTTTGGKAWQTWTDMIKWLYAKPNSNLLMQPLGLWLPNYDTNFACIELANLHPNQPTLPLNNKCMAPIHTIIPEQ